MIEGFTFFKYDRVVKLHFTTEQYNLFEQNGVAKGLTYEKFLAKTDYNLYIALARKFETDVAAIQFLVANYAYRNPSPIHNLAASNRNLITWSKRKQSITNTFREDIDKVSLYLEKNKLETKDLFYYRGVIPELFKIYLSGNITVESMFLIDKINPYIRKWKREHSLLWLNEFLLIEKLDRFVKYNEENIRKIYINALQY